MIMLLHILNELNCLFLTVKFWLEKYNKKLSCRKETVQLLRGSVLAKYKW